MAPVAVVEAAVEVVVEKHSPSGEVVAKEPTVVDPLEMEAKPQRAGQPVMLVRLLVVEVPMEQVAPS